MQAYDLDTKIDVDVAFKIQLIDSNTTTVGEIIDTKLHESLVFAVQAGTLADGAYAVQIFVGDASDMADEVQISTDNETADSLIGDAISFADTEDDIVKKVGVVSSKRYARIKIVSTSITSGGTLGAVAVKGNKRHEG